MFCLGCGSEITIRTEFCPVCGQRIGEAPRPAPASPSISSARNLGPRPPAAPAPPSYPAAPLRAPASQPASAYTGFGARSAASGPTIAPYDSVQSPATPGVAVPVDASDTAPRISAMRPPEQAGPFAGMSGIRLGDLDGMAFPRDPSGRVVVAAAAAVIVSLFLPWISFASVSITPNHVGRFTLATIGVAILAAAPTFWGPRRRRQVAAVAPFGLGALLLGAGLLYADQYMSISAQEGVTLGVGLYLFLLSAATLVIAGYRVLMEALAAQQAPSMRPAPTIAAYPGYPASPDGAPSAPSAPLATGAAARQGEFASPAAAYPTAPAPATPATPATRQAPPPGAPLRPGDPRWDEAVAPPPVVRRPAYGGGWGRGGVSRR